MRHTALAALCALNLACERAPLSQPPPRAPAPELSEPTEQPPQRPSAQARPAPADARLSELWFALRLRDEQALARCLSARHGPLSVERLLAPARAEALRDQIVRRFDGAQLARLESARRALDRIAGGLRASDVLALKTRGQRRESPGRLELSLAPRPGPSPRGRRLVLIEEGGAWLLDEFSAPSADTSARLSEVERALQEGADEWTVDALRAILPRPDPSPHTTK